LLLPAARVDLIERLFRRVDQMRNSGWLTFSAVVLIISGIMRVFDAIWAFGVYGLSAHYMEKTA
jgi:hypothetical protein